MKDYDVSLLRAVPHGIIIGVTIPTENCPVPEDILNRLHPEEAVLARTLSGFRQIQFVGGRIAIRTAIYHLGERHGPLMRTERGAVTLPSHLSGSITHKGSLALAMVSKNDGCTLGVDLEDYLPARPGIESKILRPEEIAAMEGLPADRRWMATLIRFSIKEAIYKALDPYLNRYIGFEEALVTPDLQGRAHVQLYLPKSDGLFHVDAHYTWLNGRLLTSVRIRKREGSVLYDQRSTR